MTRIALLILCSVRGIIWCPWHTGGALSHTDSSVDKNHGTPGIGILRHCIFDLSCQLSPQRVTPLYFHWLPPVWSCQASHLLIVWLLDFHDDRPGIGIDLMGGIGRNRDHDSSWALFVTAFPVTSNGEITFPFIMLNLNIPVLQTLPVLNFFDPVSRIFQFFRCYSQIAFPYWS